MVGGVHGAKNVLGTIVEKGWIACGFPTETKSPPERTWALLRSKT